MGVRGRHLLEKTTVPKITEFDIQRAVCIHLEKHAHPDVVWWHTPNGGSRDAREGARFKQIGVKAGIFDLSFLHRGKFYALELKDAVGKVSPAQLEMWERYAAAGVAGISWANSLLAARQQIYAWGLTAVC
jgi:hypothetical protein